MTSRHDIHLIRALLSVNEQVLKVAMARTCVKDDEEKAHSEVKEENEGAEKPKKLCLLSDEQMRWAVPINA